MNNFKIFATTLALCLTCTSVALADPTCAALHPPTNMYSNWHVLFPPGRPWSLHVGYTAGKCINHVAVIVEGQLAGGGGGTGGREDPILPMAISKDEHLTRLAGAYRQHTDCDGYAALLWLSVWTDKNRQEVWWGGGKLPYDNAFDVSAPTGQYIAGLCGLAGQSGPLPQRYVWGIGPMFGSLPAAKTHRRK